MQNFRLPIALETFISLSFVPYICIEGLPMYGRIKEWVRYFHMRLSSIMKQYSVICLSYTVLCKVWVGLVAVFLSRVLAGQENYTYCSTLWIVSFHFLLSSSLFFSSQRWQQLHCFMGNAEDPVNLSLFKNKNNLTVLWIQLEVRAHMFLFLVSFVV